MGAGRILVVDDDPGIRDMLKEVLDEEGYDVSTAEGGREAIDAVEAGLADLLMLDLKMPGMSGFGVLEAIRKFSDIPIIIVSGLDSVEDKDRCLELGADDYIVKGLELTDLDDLRLRVKAAFARRSRQKAPALLHDYTDGYLAIDFEAGLEPKECDLLHELVINAGKALAREDLLTGVRGPEYRNDHHILDKCISSLRGRIERDPRNPGYIVTIYRVGYRFQTRSMQAPDTFCPSVPPSATPFSDYQI